MGSFRAQGYNQTKLDFNPPPSIIEDTPQRKKIERKAPIFKDCYESGENILKSTRKVLDILLRLVEKTDGETVQECYAYIAGRADISVSTAKRHVRLGEGAGLFSVFRERVTVTMSKQNVYRINHAHPFVAQRRKKLGFEAYGRGKNVAPDVLPAVNDGGSWSIGH